MYIYRETFRNLIQISTTMKELNVKQLFTSKAFSVSGVGREGTGGASPQLF